MLKVVGASWYKTNVAICILIGACLGCIGLYFVGGIIGELRPEYDDSYAYCTTIYWTKQTSFNHHEFWGRIKDFDSVPRGTARACYKDNRLGTGWSQFEVETQAGFPDWVQAYSAGILEGSMTWLNIYMQWDNTINSYCDQDEETQNFCTWLRDTIMTNFKNVKRLSETYKENDHYHHQIRLYYFQLEGLHRGIKKAIEKARKEVDISFADLLILNTRGGDMDDLRDYYNNFVMEDKKPLEVHPDNIGKMFLKIDEQIGKPKILFGHNSEGDYSTMLRIVKKYKFRYHFNEKYDSKLVSNTNIEFTGYPGVLYSSDEFYILSGKLSKLIIGAVRIKNENKNLLRSINIEGTILSGPRIMAANRLARSPKQYAKFLARDPAFGSKQWLIVDEKRLNHVLTKLKDFENFIETEAEPIPVTSATLTAISNEKFFIDGKQKNPEATDLLAVEKSVEQNSMNFHDLIWVIDQIPNRLHGQDVTHEFDLSGAWLLDGNIYFKQLELESHTKSKNPAVESRNITTLQAVADFLQKNSFRGDLEESPTPFGNTDTKLYTNFDVISSDWSEEMKDSKTSKFLIKSGPPFDKKITIPFNWNANSNFGVKHNGHPVIFDFDFFETEFAWN